MLLQRLRNYFSAEILDAKRATSKSDQRRSELEKHSNGGQGRPSHFYF